MELQFRCTSITAVLIMSSHKNLRYDCNNTPAQGWRLNSLGTQVALWGTDFCLDAGSSEKSHI